MSELSFEQMLEESLKTIRTGEVVTGKVIDVKEDEIVLNIATSLMVSFRKTSTPTSPVLTSATW